MPVFTSDRLRAVTSLIVSRMGSDAEETALVTDHLVRANLAGHDSHGVGMLPAYVRLLQDGLLVPNQDAGNRARFRRPAGARRAPRLRPAHGRRIGPPRDRAGAGGRGLRAGDAQFLPYRPGRHLWGAGGGGGHGLHRLRERRRPPRHRRALWLRRAAARHQPLRHRGAGRRGAGAAGHGHHHHRRRQGPRGAQQGREGAGRLPDRRRRRPHQRPHALHRRPHAAR